METIIYFVRHAESIYSEGTERTRGLTDKGRLDALKVQSILIDENIDIFISSPYERAIQTIQYAAGTKEIAIFEDLRERQMGQIGEMDFREAKRNVYEDIRFSFPNGETSFQAQERAINVIRHILIEHRGCKVVIGTHGDIMTLILSYFDKRYDFEFWKSTSMPDIYQLQFREHQLIKVTRLWE